MTRLGSHLKRAAWAAVLFLGIALMSGCGGSKKADETLAEKSLEKAIEKATGGKAKVDLSEGKIKVETKEGTTEISSSTDWPEDLPGVPKFTYGKVKEVSRLNQEQKKLVNIFLEELQDGALGKYLEVLKGNDWKIVSTMNLEKGGIIQAEKDKLIIVLTVNADNKTGYMSVTNSETR